jgi:hypothetical protein
MPQLSPPMYQFRKGVINFSLLSLQKTVTFTTPMPSTDYDLFFQTPTGASVAISITTKDVNGFTIQVGINLSSMDIVYYAVEARANQ